ncbi:MAG: S8 family serine peptidase [Bdellovibrionales bacterium]|nr:S8 family serine peptidase [Bdellovibrionales bacterium]
MVVSSVATSGECSSSVRQLPSFCWLPLILFSVIVFCGEASAEARAVAGEYLLKFAPAAATSATERRVMRSVLGVSLHQEHPLTGIQLVSVGRGGALNERYAKDLLAEGLLEYIEPNYVVHTLDVPNDPSFSQLWGMRNEGQTGGTAGVDIDAPEAWELTTGSEEVVVGVVDTGINYLHPDLQANMWRNPDEIAGNGLDDDSNGVVDDVYGFSALQQSGDPLDQNGHGTHCAGTIGGRGNNGIGIAGVNWKVRLMALQFLDASGYGSTEGAIAAIEYAVAMKRAGVNLRVLNNSWGGGGYSLALEDAIRAAQDAGILFVVAAGNSGADNDASPTYPANYDLDNIVTVGALDHNGNLASFSNFGATSVHVAAPGVDILSTWLGEGYTSLNGTSMATPHVTGVAALVLSREPTLGYRDLRSRLVQTVSLLPQLSGLIAAPGIVNAQRALTNARTPLPPPPPRVQYRQLDAAFGYQTSLGEHLFAADDEYRAVDLGFTFPFYGTDYQRIAISSNGRIVPLSNGSGVPGTADYSNSPLPGIAVYHDDLVPSPTAGDAGGVWVKHESGKVVITWIVASYAHRANSNAERELRFQLHLYSDGRLRYHYLDTDAGDGQFNFGASATIGIAPLVSASGERVIASHNTSSPTVVGSGKAIGFEVAKGTAAHDYDGDGVSDIAVWRPATGMWFVLTSSSSFDYDQHLAFQLGLPGDLPLQGDFDGDGRAEFVVWRPANGTWYYRRSGSDYAEIVELQWGLPGDEPVVGDYDGDGVSDFAVYRRETGAFLALLSGAGFDRSGALSGANQSAMAVGLGGPANDPLVGDFNGDGEDDFAVVWQLERFWSIKDGLGSLLYSLPWGQAGDTPLSCDLDADGTADRVMVRVSSGNTLEWYGALANGGVSTSSFGSLGDKPTCDRDFDGDGRVDQAVYRAAAGEWFIRYSSTGAVQQLRFGLPGDSIS